MLIRHRAVFCLVLLLLCALSPVPRNLSFAQTETATLTGRISDPQGAVVPGAQVEITNIDTGIKTTAATNNDGLYVVPSLLPGRYRVIVHKDGFKEIVKPDVVLHVQDNVALNFSLEVGSVTQSVTVAGGAPLVNTQDAAVSTVVDRNFAENLPLNGRSFQTLIGLTPGVVFTPAGGLDQGQFSVNGQRATSNYFLVDGVSSNISIVTSPSGGPSQTTGGSIPGFSVLGGTNNLVSQDALQEFRIQTSTYAPEFGRSPGAQVSIVTRSGTNGFHGTAFEYLRNDKLDANDWFSNQKGLPKSQERINDFGGVLGGPILQNRTFFFLSYEGQRLRLPQTGITTVPSVNARQSAPPETQPFLNAYPLPNGPEILDSNGNPTGQAPFDAGFSNQSTLNATSIRIDHILARRLTLFGRYNYAPSDLLQRGGGVNTLNTLTPSRIRTQTLTVGATSSITSSLSNDFRFNYSRNEAAVSNRLDTFGGAAVPPDSALFPNPFSRSDAFFVLRVFGAQGASWFAGKLGRNLQRQFNVVDNTSLQRGSHSLKFGIDYRRLTPVFDPLAYNLGLFFFGLASANSGSPAFLVVNANRGGTLLFRNLGAFAQDTWRVASRLAVTYGLRWDTEFAPATLDGPDLLAVTGFNNPSAMALAPSGTPIFDTKYGNFAPRLGVAYELRRVTGWETVLRGGVGLFYDLATAQAGDALATSIFPFGASKFVLGPQFGGPNIGLPPDPSLTQPPPISVDSLKSGQLVAFNPDLNLPRTLQWNFTVEQSLGNQQAVILSYVGASGRQLIQPTVLVAPNSNFLFVERIDDKGTSDYHSLQAQYRRRLSRGLQALASYTWSHSLDTGSGSSSGTASSGNLIVNSLGARANRGPSDFDVRHALSVAVIYDFPAPGRNRVVHNILREWSVDNIIQARTATPVNVFNSLFTAFSGNLANIRPDVVPGVSFFLSDPSVAGGRRLNNTVDPSRPGCLGPFCPPPLDANGNPTRQGTLGRNALRGFGVAQWDFAVRRQFNLHESWRLQFRAEFFNLLNHPNFANPIGDLSDPLFGQSTTTLARGLGGQFSGTGGFNSIFQVGGPRSIQFALKLQF